MTYQEANKIKKVLRKENAVFESTAGYYDRTNEVLRVKVVDFIEKSNFMDAKIVPDSTEQRTKKTRDNIIAVLRALSKNGMRPKYRTEQRQTSNALGAWDSRYIIFE